MAGLISPQAFSPPPLLLLLVALPPPAPLPLHSRVLCWKPSSPRREDSSAGCGGADPGVLRILLESVSR
uniref:Uncharacterized protein n=1 Tax=Oryza glumipatula TaxID=40148 RepID=A0A0E0AH71_9ORYZ